jgi:hypothetical protein
MVLATPVSLDPWEFRHLALPEEETYKETFPGQLWCIDAYSNIGEVQSKKE